MYCCRYRNVKGVAIGRCRIKKVTPPRSRVSPAPLCFTTSYHSCTNHRHTHDDTTSRTRLQTVAAEHLVRSTQRCLQEALPLLLGVDNDGFCDTVLALFRADRKDVKLRKAQRGGRKSSRGYLSLVAKKHDVACRMLRRNRWVEQYFISRYYKL